jgi:tetratricopeptide (TPR) repeat protein
MKRMSLIIVATCLLLTGCAQSHLASKQEAALRWNTARNRVHFRLAQDAYENGRLAQCREMLSKVLASETAFVPAYLLAAKVAMREGRYIEAREYLEMSAEAAPELADVWYGRAMLNEQAGDIDSALRDALKAAELDPSTPEYLMCVSELEVRSGQSDRALATLSAVEGRFATHTGLQSALADLYMLHSDYKAASLCLRRIVLMDPDDVAARERLGISLARSGQARDAVPVLNELVKRGQSKSLSLRYALGQSHMKLGQFKQAERVYASLCGDQPNNPDWNYHLAECYAMQNDDAAALERLELALAIAPSHGEARALAGYLYFAAANLERAEEHLQVAVDTVDDPALVAVVLTKTLRGLGKAEEADECWAEFGAPISVPDNSGRVAKAAVVPSREWTLTGQMPKETLRR